jgi:hypothetical protein
LEINVSLKIGHGEQGDHNELITIGSRCPKMKKRTFDQGYKSCLCLWEAGKNHE